MNLKSIYLMLLSGILLTISFPPIPFPFLAFLAFLPLLSSIENNLDKKFKFFRLPLYLTFFVYHTGTNWWISSFQEQTDPFLMASGFALDLLHPFFFFIPIYIYYLIRKKSNSKNAIYLFPLIWTLFEWAHGLGEFSYPWLTVGNTQAESLKWIQMADITGVWGLSFLIVLFNVLSYKLISSYKGYGLFVHIKDAKNGRLISALFLILLIPIIYGEIQLKKYSHENIKNENPTLRISLVQANINPWEKWSGGSVDLIRKNMKLQDSISKEIKNIDLSIWSETTILRLSRRFNTDLEMQFLKSWSRSKNLALISGFVHDYRYKENEERQVSARFIERDSMWYESFNSSIIVQEGKQIQIYHKSKLTPFAERIPYVNYVSFLMDYIKWGVGISSWGLGKGASNLKYYKDQEEIKIGTIICIESIYPGFCRGFAQDGAEVLALITNDAWYDGTPGPRQHYEIAKIRAIESRRYIARCANSGVTGFISASGESIKEAPQYERLSIYEDIPLIKSKSIYVQYGDWFCYALLISSFVIGFYLVRKKHSN